jgi:DNA adenine methylase
MRVLRGPAPRPFLKWVGGKGKLVPRLKAMMPKGAHRMRYVEPFLGGGAMFFALHPTDAVVADMNPDLVQTYECVRDSLPELTKVLGRLERLHRHDPEATYYAVRNRFNMGKAGSGVDVVGRAARFIYLNRTCFNGVYRVNKAGHFNVPIGRYTNPLILDDSTLRAARWALKNVALERGSFVDTLSGVGRGDFVYLDPPYEPLSKTANFTSFTKEGFTHVDQTALAKQVAEISKRGAKVMVSNSDTTLVRTLYRGYDIQEIKAARAVNSKATARGDVIELVIRNYT